MIVQTITDPYHFWNWLKNSGSYQNNFSMQGAYAVQQYFDELSDSMDEPTEFDPIAWCVEFSEFDNIDEAFLQHHGEYEPELPQDQGNRTPEQRLEWFEDNTTVLKVDGGHVVIGEF